MEICKVQNSTCDKVIRLIIFNILLDLTLFLHWQAVNTLLDATADDDYTIIIILSIGF